jgi:hypothetical protein
VAGGVSRHRAVAHGADRWVGPATDATAYADLVAAVLARREALSPMQHFTDRTSTEPPPEPAGPRHTERRSRPRWPGGRPPTDPAPTSLPTTTGSGSVTIPSLPPQTWQPRTTVAPLPGPDGLSTGAPQDVRRIGGLPSRPPGKHRLPPPPPTQPQAIDLSENLGSVLDWLGRPES